MSEEISKLEANILNVQSSIETLKEGFERHNQEMGLRVSNALSKLPEAKKVLVRTLPLKYDGIAVYADFRVELIGSGDPSYGSGELSEDLSTAVRTEVKEFYRATEPLANKWKKLQDDERKYMNKLAPFTEIEVVRKHDEAHAHIYTVREEKVYAGTLIVSPLVGICAYVPEQETDTKGLEARRLGKCPMYIARHPSRLATHELMTEYAVKHILNSLKDAKNEQL